MKEISGNFIDLDTEDEDGRCAFMPSRIRRHPRRHSKPRGRRLRTRLGNRKAIGLGF
jgi:hypothetical protein